MPHSWRVSEADSESRPPFQSLDCWACSFSGDTHEARASKLKPRLPQHTDLKAQSLGRGWPPGCSDRTAEQLDHLQWDGAERRPQGQLSLSGPAQSTFPEMPQESKMGAHQHQMRQACSPPPPARPSTHDEKPSYHRPSLLEALCPAAPLPVLQPTRWSEPERCASSTPRKAWVAASEGYVLLAFSQRQGPGDMRSILAEGGREGAVLLRS